MKLFNLWSPCGLLTLFLGAAPAPAQPLIFHASETASPGDVIGLQGANFGPAPQVWMEHLSGTETSLSPQVQLTVLNSTNCFVSALIPTNETSGLYAVWVKAGASLSGPVYMNRARAWGANDLCGSEVDSGRSFRLFGRNLCPPGATPTVRFVSGTTSLKATVTVPGSDPYMLKVTAPTLVPGAVYEIYVSNGSGGAYGETKSTFQLKGRAGGTDAFGLGVPWGADFTFAGNVYDVKSDTRLGRHAVGDGAANDTAAIQGAINTASAAGGGVVYLPAGNYKIVPGTVEPECGLRLKSKVVLRGAGTNASHVLFTGWNPAKSAAGLLALDVSLSGLVDLDLHNTAEGGSLNFRSEKGTAKFFALRTLFQTDAGVNLRCTGCRQVVIQDCTLASATLRRAADGEWNMKMLDNADVIFANNRVTWHVDYVELYRSVRTLIANNHFTRDTYVGSYNGVNGGFYPTGSRQAVIYGNTFDKSGAGEFVDHNDGETILEENCNDQPSQDYGSVSSATATTLTDASKHWSVDYAAPINPNTGRGYSVAIVRGPGLGQLRKIVASTADTLTVDKAWEVLPTSASRYTIQYVAENYLIYSNHLTSGRRGIWIYSSTMRDLSIVNNTLTDSEGIWLRTDYRPFEKRKRFNVQYEVYVSGNQVQDLNGVYAAYIGSTHQIVRTNGDFGTSTYGLEYRQNTVLAHLPNVTQQFSLHKESYYSTPVQDPGTPYLPSTDGATMSHLGLIFQDNTAVDTEHAFELGTGDYLHVLWNNHTWNANTFLNERTGRGVDHGSIGTVTNHVPDAPATGPLKTSAVNPRYFADPSGQIVFLTGSHTWGNLQDYTYSGLPSAPPMDFAAYLAFLEQHHHNFFRLWCWECAVNPNAKQTTTAYEPLPYERTGPGTALDGKPKFDLTRFNPDYFGRMRVRLAAAGARGMYASVMLFNGFSMEGKGNVAGDPWQGHPFNPRNNINGVDGGGSAAIHSLSNAAVAVYQQAYVRKIIDTVNDLDNVLYEISNEDRTSEADTAWQYAMIRFIHNYEAGKPKQHPVGMTATWPDEKTATFLDSPADWVSLPDRLPTADGRKVLINDTDHSYFWIALKKDGLAAQREWVWENFTRGNQCLFMDPYLDPSHDADRNHPVGGQPDPYWDTLRQAMGQTRTFAQRMDLATALPHAELASTSFCLARPGAEYLIYQPKAGEAFSAQLQPGAYDFEWFNPELAQVASRGRIDCPGAAQTFTPPFKGDAVLYLKAS